jgi:hypothetical protein
MAIINTLLGGTNLASSTMLRATDLNDTFNAAANLGLTLSAFWMNANLRTTYDNFDSYTTGDAVPSTKWTTTGDGTFITRASTNAGGSTKEGELYVSVASNTTVNCYTETVSLTANKHKYAKLYWYLNFSYGSATVTADALISFDGGSSYFNLGSISNLPSSVSNTTANGLSNILVIAKGSNEYDCYLCGKLVQTVTDASFTLKFKVTATSNSAGDAGYAYIYIDDVYESAYAV